MGIFFFFFFQAEDGIRDCHVTGVQTCALPICSPTPPALIKDIRRLLPKAKLLQVYGLSEAGFLTGLTDAEHTNDRLQSCGRACPGIDLRVVHPNGGPVVSGELGNLVARGPGIMVGYWRDIDEDLPKDESSVDETTKAF